jgi:hypothetical protein
MKGALNRYKGFGIAGLVKGAVKLYGYESNTGIFQNKGGKTWTGMKLLSALNRHWKSVLA